MTRGVLPWRVGRSLGRSVYDGADQFMGLLDTQVLAERVVEAVNGVPIQAARLTTAERLLARVRDIEARLPAELAADVRAWFDP